MTAASEDAEGITQSFPLRAPVRDTALPPPAPIHMVPVNAASTSSPTPPRLVEAELLAPEPMLAHEEHRLARLVDIRHALAEVRTMPEALDIRSTARALQVFMQQRQYSREMINDAVEIYLRASRWAGTMLLAMEKNKGAATPSHDESASPPTLDAAGPRPQPVVPPATAGQDTGTPVRGVSRRNQSRPRASSAPTGWSAIVQALERQEKRATEAAPERGATLDASPGRSRSRKTTAPPCPAAPASDPRTAIADEIVTRVMDYVREALADVPASAIQAGFEQAVDELRRRIAEPARPCLSGKGAPPMKAVLITFMICATALIALVIAAIAFKSDLRAQLLEILGWSTAGAGLAATLSPIDLIPDFLLGVGQLDDAVYLCAALAGRCPGLRDAPPAAPSAARLSTRPAVTRRTETHPQLPGKDTSMANNPSYRKQRLIKRRLQMAESLAKVPEQSPRL